MLDQTSIQYKSANSDFKIDEVVELKGHFFKVVLIDAFAGKIALKWISKQEAKQLQGGQISPGSLA